MDQFKETPLLEGLLTFHKDACNICHIFEVLPLHLEKWQTESGRIWSFANHGVKHSDKHVHRIVNCIEQLTVN